MPPTARAVYLPQRRVTEKLRWPEQEMTLALWTGDVNVLVHDHSLEQHGVFPRKLLTEGKTSIDTPTTLSDPTVELRVAPFGHCRHRSGRSLHSTTIRVGTAIGSTTHVGEESTNAITRNLALPLDHDAPLTY
jgi:hypothetical protein